MIIITGDIHGDFWALKKLTNNNEINLIIQCGDLGWWPRYRNWKK